MVGEGVGLGMGDDEGVSEGETLGEGERVAEGERVGDGERVVDGERVGEGERVGDIVEVGMDETWAAGSGVSANGFFAPTPACVPPTYTIAAMASAPTATTDAPTWPARAKRSRRPCRTRAGDAA